MKVPHNQSLVARVWVSSGNRALDQRSRVSSPWCSPFQSGAIRRPADLG